MGNTSSQPTSDFDDSLSQSKQKHSHSYSKTDTIPKVQDSNPNNTPRVHPLLNPADLRSQISPPTTAMTSQENGDQSKSESLQSKNNSALANSAADVTMSGTGQSTANLAPRSSAMSIDNEQATDIDRLVPPRGKSTMILTDDPDYEKLKLLKTQQSKETSGGANELTPNTSSAPETIQKTIVPVEIQWFQGGKSVFITGSFTGWRKMIKLVKGSEEKFSIKLKLPYGTHRFRFIVDNELRFSDYLPTATDQMGNFVNYIEIQTPEVSKVNFEQSSNDQKESDANVDVGVGTDDGTDAGTDVGADAGTDAGADANVDIGAGAGAEAEANADVNADADTGAGAGAGADTDVSAKSGHNQTFAAKNVKTGFTNDEDDMGNGYSRFHQETPQTPQFDYVRIIPAIFTDPSVMEQYYANLESNQNNNQNQSWLTPPQLPPHLESVILNNYSNTDKSNSSGALPIPNHVVLNHLATTSIKHSTLAVASVVRYKRKYATQVLYAPLQ